MYNSFGCDYLTSWVYGRPNPIYIGKCSISVIELLYDNNLIIISKFILVYIYI